MNITTLKSISKTKPLKFNSLEYYLKFETLVAFPFFESDRGCRSNNIEHKKLYSSLFSVFNIAELLRGILTYGEPFSSPVLYKFIVIELILSNRHPEFFISCCCT